jgi:hypothetical protein
MHRIHERMNLPEGQRSKYGYADCFANFLAGRMRRSPASPPASATDIPRAWLMIAPAPSWSPILESDRSRLADQDDVFRILYRDFHHTTLPVNLRDYDRLSMAHGVEVRAPFLDYRLVSFTFSLPTTSKLGGGYTKRILRDALGDILPERIRHRATKLGFSNPHPDWLQREPLRQLMLDSVRSARFLSAPLWNGREIARQVECAYDGGDAVTLVLAWRIVLALHLQTAFAAHPN